MECSQSGIYGGRYNGRNPEEIPVKDEVKKALISYEGDAGKLMLLILAYEKADWKESKKLAGELGIDATTLARNLYGLYPECK